VNLKAIIPSAFFSARFAELIRLRGRRQADGVNLPEGVGDVHALDDCWERAAEAFRQSDPEGKRVRELMAELKDT
jgi:hypothetical protein